MRLISTFRSGAITVALAILLMSFFGYRHSAASSAAASAPTDVCQLRSASAGAIQGRVESVTSHWADESLKLIESDVLVRVTAAPFGPFLPGSVVTVRVRGGQMSDLKMVASEEATFVAGEEVLVFLSADAAASTGADTISTHRVTSGAQGKFDVIGNLALNEESRAAYRLDSLLAAVRPEAAPEQDGCAAPAPLVKSDAAAGDAGGVRTSTAIAAPDNYVYNGYKWPGVDPMEEQYLINVNSADAAANGGTAAFAVAIINAGNTWTAVPSAKFTFRYGGPTGVTVTALDEINSVHWENMGAGTLLAQATWWYDTSTGRIVETDIRFNDSQAWDATGSPSGGEADLQSVALHELGHWLSLGHDNDPVCTSCPATGPSMCSCYQLGSLKRSLATNDINGISAIYPMPLSKRVYLPLIRR